MLYYQYAARCALYAERDMLWYNVLRQESDMTQRFLAIALIVVLAFIGLTVVPAQAQLQPLYNGTPMFGVPTSPVTAPRPGMVVSMPTAPTPNPTMTGKLELPYGVKAVPTDTYVEFRPIFTNPWTDESIPAPEVIKVPTCVDERGVRRLNAQLGCIEPKGGMKLSIKLEPNMEYRVWAFSSAGWDEYVGGRIITLADSSQPLDIRLNQPGVTGNGRLSWASETQVRARIVLDATQYYGGYLVVRVMFIPEGASYTKGTSKLTPQVQHWYLWSGEKVPVDFWFQPGKEQENVPNGEICGTFQVTYYDYRRSDDLSWTFIDKRVCGLSNKSPFGNVDGYGW